MINAAKPSKYENTIRLNICSFCTIATAKNPAKLEAAVAIKIGINTAHGLAEPSSVRYIKILIGIMVTAEALITINIISAFDAVSLRGLSSCICSMALRPIGVAALSSPSMLAAIFITIEPIAGWCSGISGMIFLNNGVNPRASKSVRPDFSAIFKRPSHKQSMPVKLMAMLNADFAEANKAFIISVQISGLPPKNA